VNYIVTPDDVRGYLELNGSASSRYDDATIGSNIWFAQSYLEAECHRWFADHPSVTWATTTLLQAQVPLPGFRSFASVTWGGTIMSVAVPGDGNTSPSAWGLWEQSPGVQDGTQLVVGLQFRPWRVDNDRPWYYADALWWDKLLDSPFYPGNWGGGYAWTSMPNDLVIVGDGGYAPGTAPVAVWGAVRALASWYTMRPAGMFGNTAVSPGGAAIAYSDLPPEVIEFVADWKIGQQAAGVG
jgi:hypothetical protein